jgi:RNA polymerase sigma-70 factor, ECF subfamily
MIGTVSASLDALAFMDEAARDGGPPSGPESSFDLVQRARAGDQAAVETLFARYWPRIQRWARGRLPAGARSAHDTDDLVQNTLKKVFLRLHRFEPRHPGAFRAYVWTTLWNCIRDMARESARTGPADPLDSTLEDHGPSPYEITLGRQTLECYERALDRLTPDDKEAIIARVEIRLPYEEIAAALGKPSIPAAHMAVSRALVRLAKEMAHERKR